VSEIPEVGFWDGFLLPQMVYRFLSQDLIGRIMFIPRFYTEPS